MRCERVKTALILMLVGALVGVSVASFLVPPMLSWYTSPGGLPKGAQIQAVVQIPEVIRHATFKLLGGRLSAEASRPCLACSLALF